MSIARPALRSMKQQVLRHGQHSSSLDSGVVMWLQAMCTMTAAPPKELAMTRITILCTLFVLADLAALVGCGGQVRAPPGRPW